MRKTTLVAASLAAFASAAQAQSSVELFGLIDAGVVYTNNQVTSNAPLSGHSNFQAASGTFSGSRWGLRGAEDLGSGLKAIFMLESGFDATNGKAGQGGRLFGRQAYVGLSGAEWGSMTLGRQYDSVADYLSPLSLAGNAYGGGPFAHPFDNDNVGNSFRLNNSIKYSSADYNGLTFGGLYALSNQAGGASNNRAFSLGAAYANGPLSLGAAYMQINHPGATGYGALDGSAASGDATFAAGRQRVYGVGANYAVGPATLGAVWTRTMLDNAASINNNGLGEPTALAAGTNARFDNFEINSRYSLTPALTLVAAYTFTNSRFDSPGLATARPKWNQFSVAADYALSKRTDVYLAGAYQHLKGNRDAAAEIGGAGISGGGQSARNKQIVVATGIRHRF